MNKLNQQEWNELSRQTKKVRHELLKLLCLTSGKLSKDSHAHVTQSIKQIDTFQSKAESIFSMQNKW